MQNQNYLKLLVEQLHSTTVATLGADGHPQTRVIDMMLWDAQGVYFLTARGKAFSLRHNLDAGRRHGYNIPRINR